MTDTSRRVLVRTECRRGRICSVFPFLSLGKSLSLEAHILEGLLEGEPGIILQVLSWLTVTRKIYILHGNLKIYILAFCHVLWIWFSNGFWLMWSLVGSEVMSRPSEKESPTDCLKRAASLNPGCREREWRLECHIRAILVPKPLLNW